jgi:hypothetical protein
MSVSGSIRLSLPEVKSVAVAEKVKVREAIWVRPGRRASAFNRVECEVAVADNAPGM